MRIDLWSRHEIPDNLEHFSDNMKGKEKKGSSTDVGQNGCSILIANPE